MSVIEHFTTRSVAPQSRLDFWNRIAGETFGGMVVDSAAEQFNAELWRWPLASLTLVRPHAQMGTIRRWQEIAPPCDADVLLLHMQRSGHSRNTQNDRTTELRAGDFEICHGGEPYVMQLPAEHELLVVEMPRAMLAARVPGLNDKLSHRYSGKDISARLLHDFLDSLWRQGDQSHADPLWQQQIADIFVDLLAVALRTGGRPGEGQDQSRLAQRIMAFIDAQLTDPLLKTSSIADAMGVSARTVQNVFATMRTTPSGHIQKLRLERAARLLANTERPASITEIAFDCGFNDSAYFTRCFRHQFGLSPREFRNR